MGGNSMAGSEAPRRLYGMMQFLMAHYAEATPPIPAEPRGVVGLQDALDAVLQVGFVIDEATQAGAIPVERGLHAGSMLMVLRDYLQPLPPAPDDGQSPDPCARDLQELVKQLQGVRAPDSLPADWN